MRALQTTPQSRDLLFLLRSLLTALLGTTLFLCGHTLHHLSCRTGPHGRAYLAKNAGSLRPTDFRVWVAAGMGGTTTFNIHRSFEVVCPVPGGHRFNLIVNMRSLSHIVKQLFMKIVIETKCSTSVPRIFLRRTIKSMAIRGARELRATGPREAFRAFDAARCQCTAQRFV